jgi:phosphoribosyl-ATP pyrophosphohydrolase/phosphoribosyl-AMP cyclohydrolase
MMAWMNRESILKTIETGFVHYYSRSRQKLWKKGEESGHLQLVKEIRLDCDGDTVLILVHQYGGVACHTGRANCFFHQLQDQNHLPIQAERLESGQTQSLNKLHWEVVEPVIKNMRTGMPEKSGCQPNAFKDVLFRVFETLKQRQMADPDQSYVAKLLHKGENAVLKKVGEEATELVMAAKDHQLEQVVYEMVDLWFHTLIALLQQGGSLELILAEFQRREGVSGLVEFKQRENKTN